MVLSGESLGNEPEGSPLPGSSPHEDDSEDQQISNFGGFASASSRTHNDHNLANAGLGAVVSHNAGQDAQQHNLAPAADMLGGVQPSLDAFGRSQVRQSATTANTGSVQSMRSVSHLAQSYDTSDLNTDHSEDVSMPELLRQLQRVQQNQQRFANQLRSQNTGRQPPLDQYGIPIQTHQDPWQFGAQQMQHQQARFGQPQPYQMQRPMIPPSMHQPSVYQPAYQQYGPPIIPVSQQPGYGPLATYTYPPVPESWTARYPLATQPHQMATAPPQIQLPPNHQALGARQPTYQSTYQSSSGPPAQRQQATSQIPRGFTARPGGGIGLLPDSPWNPSVDITMGDFSALDTVEQELFAGSVTRRDSCWSASLRSFGQAEAILNGVQRRLYHEPNTDDWREVWANASAWAALVFRAMISLAPEVADDQDSLNHMNALLRKFNEQQHYEAVAFRLVMRVIENHARGVILRGSYQGDIGDKAEDDNNIRCSQRLKIIIKLLMSNKRFGLDLLSDHSSIDAIAVCPNSIDRRKKGNATNNKKKQAKLAMVKTSDGRTRAGRKAALQKRQKRTSTAQGHNEEDNDDPENENDSESSEGLFVTDRPRESASGGDRRSTLRQRSSTGSHAGTVDARPSLTVKLKASRPGQGTNSDPQSGTGAQQEADQQSLNARLRESGYTQSQYGQPPVIESTASHLAGLGYDDWDERDYAPNAHVAAVRALQQIPARLNFGMTPALGQPTFLSGPPSPPRRRSRVTIPPDLFRGNISQLYGDDDEEELVDEPPPSKRRKRKTTPETTEKSQKKRRKAPKK